MEDIQIISSIIDEYKERFKDNDYKNLMDSLLRIHDKIKECESDDESDDESNYEPEEEQTEEEREEERKRDEMTIIVNSEPQEFSFKRFWETDDIDFDNKVVYHNKYTFTPVSAKTCYTYYFKKYFTFTNNRNDIIDAKILQNKLNLKFNEINILIKYLEDTTSNVIITTQFEKDNVKYFTGIKEKV